jgi:PAS domain S-box-containing protein
METRHPHVIWFLGGDAKAESLACDAFQPPEFQLVIKPSSESGAEMNPDSPDAFIVSPDSIRDLSDVGFDSMTNLDGTDSVIPMILLFDGPRSVDTSTMFSYRELVVKLTVSVAAVPLRDMVRSLITIAEGLRKNRSVEIKRSEYRYRDMLENANDFIFMLDGDGRFQYLNNRFAPLTGFSKEEWMGRPFMDLIDPLFHNTAQAHYEMAHQGRARVFEACVLSTGEQPILSLGFTPLFDHGSIVGSMGIGRDVTEKKRMEKELLELKNFNESIIQSMEAGLLTLDKSGRFTSLNSGGERILGWKEKEVIGKSIKTVLQSGEAETIMARNVDRRESEITVKSGKRLSIGFTTTNRLDNKGKPVGTIISFRDITQLKQMQSEVMRMDRLASLGVLASGIAHEIKNPLAGIKTMAQACEEEFEPDDSRREYLTRIIRQVNRLDDLLKTFFAYAKPKQPNRMPVEVKDIFLEVTPLIGKKLSNSGIQYEEILPPDLPPVFVDSPQMQQVVLNLMLNAIQAMNSGGTLRVEARPVKARYSGFVPMRQRVQAKSVAFVEIRIQDTGTGIAPEHLETIFDPFFTTKSDGLGLGLSIVHRILNENRGEIRVDSMPGQGTCFIITLPAGDTG